MREILFICHRIPFPPDRGDKIRSHHIVRALARIAPVHVATFADDDFDLAEESELAAIAASYKLVRRAKSLVFAGVQALAANRPVSLSAFHDRALSHYIRQVIATRTIDTIYVFSGQMAQYVPESFAGRVVIDFVDVDSAKFEAYASRGGGIMSWIEGREGRLLRDVEVRAAERADVSLLISRTEAELFRSRLPETVRDRTDVRILGNGIDSLHFDPSLVAPETRMLDCPGPRLIFTGQMDYAPNAEAVIRAQQSIMPLVRRDLPDATFHVVGRNPVDEVLALDGKDGCHVWGRVDDIRPWLKGADVALVPLEIARGVQNKVLEAMAMALPVVLTPAAAEGIGGEHESHYRVAESDEALAGEIALLQHDSRRAAALGEAARRFVCDHSGWSGALADLGEIVGAGPRGNRNAA